MFGTYVLIIFACYANPQSGDVECSKSRYTTLEYGSAEICNGAANKALDDLYATAPRRWELLGAQCVIGSEA